MAGNNVSLHTPGTRDRGRQAMLLKVYSAAVLVLDIVVLLVKCLVSIIQVVFEVFVPPVEKSVEGEIVLITGAGHGIGRELAFKYASLKSKVVCWDINEDGNTETVKMIGDLYGKRRAFAYKCDVSNRDEVLATAKKVRAEVGVVTVLVNNAGIMPTRPLLQHTPQEIRKIFDINVLAHFWMLEAFLPDMTQNNHGHVVALSSMAGVLGLTNLVPYCASKFAVRGLMEAISEELREDARNNKIKFTTICPYMVDTGLCKKPKIRFPSIMNIVPPKVVAEEVVKAMRRNYHEMSIPSYLLFVNNVCRVLPIRAALLLKDFLDSGVEAVQD